MFRRFINLAFMLTLLAGVMLFSRFTVVAQDGKNYTAEQITETVIIFYGSRERLAQIRATDNSDH